MTVTQLTPNPVERVMFTLRSVKLLPPSSGCYVLTNFQTEILYVGITVDLVQRFKQHRETEEKRRPTVLGRAHWFYFLTTGEGEINAIERAWQNQYSSVHGILPVLNKIDSPVR